jgi:uracil-DNA glycosylase
MYRIDRKDAIAHTAFMSSSIRCLSSVNTLAALNKLFDQCPRCAAESNPLQHVHGGGAARNPKYCFVLINPTHLNISTHPEYEGPRFPFIGVRSFWRILHRAGLVGANVMSIIDEKTWSGTATRVLLRELRDRGIYVTNLVKCAQSHPELPAKRVIEEDFPLLSRELSLVNPELIVAFGQLPFRVLTGKSIRLHDYYHRLSGGEDFPKSWLLTREGKRFPVVASFFPIGRGNPRLATEILKLLNGSGTPPYRRGKQQLPFACA